MSIVAAVFIVLVFMTLVGVFTADSGSSSNRSAGMEIALNIITTICYLGLAIALTVVYRPMVVMFKDMPTSFQKIRRNFTKFFFIFLLSYLLMTLTLLLADVKVCHMESYLMIYITVFFELWPIFCVL
jgi:hypothetical protein